MKKTFVGIATFLILLLSFLALSQTCPAGERRLPTFAGTAYTGPTVDPGVATGQMLQWDGTEWTPIDVSNLVWDDINKRLGINTATPMYNLHVLPPSGGGVAVGMFEVLTSGGAYVGIKNSSRTWNFGMSGGERFGIRDVTGGNIDVVEIEPGALYRSMHIDAFGKSTFLATAGAQTRAAYDGSNYTDFHTDSTGIHTITPTGTAPGIKTAGAVFRQNVDVNAVSYDTLINDHKIYVSYTATGAVAIAIPAAQTVSGRELIIKDSGLLAGTNNITITPGSGNIEGAASYALTSNGDSITIGCDGTNWWVNQIVTGNDIQSWKTSETVNDDATIALSAAKSGRGWVQIGDNQEYTEFRWGTSGTVTLINSTANVSNSSVDGDLCVYLDGSNFLTIENKLGSALTVRVDTGFSD